MSFSDEPERAQVSLDPAFLTSHGRLHGLAFFIYAYTLKLAMIIGTLVLISKTLYSKDPDSPSMYQTEVGELAEISFEVKGFGWDSESFEVFYADQVVKEFDQSIFVMTHIEQRNQRQGRCVDWNLILCSEHCRHLKHTPSSSVTGLYTGECNRTTRRCVVDGWCDIETSHQSRQSALN